MRLKKIKIIHFGQFNNQTFVLPASSLNVFYGGNEAGKSTTVAFIKQIMFGFHLRSNSSPFFEDYQPLAHVSPMGGSLLFEDEQQNTFELERLWAKGDKTKRGLLSVKKDGQEVPANLFFDQIKNIDGNFYTDSFIFNQEMLAQVASLTEDELLQRIYYLGAANSGQLMLLRDNFNKQAASLFKKSGRKPKVNQLLKELADKRKQYQATQAQFKLFQNLSVQKNKVETQLAAAQKQLAVLQTKETHLQEIGKDLNNFARIKKLQKQVKPVSFHQNNYRQAQEIAGRCQNLAANIASLKTQIKQQKTDPALELAGAKQLVEQKAQILEWQSELQAEQKKQTQLQAAEQQLLNLYPDLKQIINLSDEEIKELQRDYAALPAPNKQTFKETSSKPYYLAGALVSFLGLIIFFAAGAIGLLVLAAGVGIFAFAYLQAKKGEQQKQAARAADERNRNKQQEFANRYGLNGQKINLDNLLNELNQYRLREQEEKGNEAEEQAINHELSDFSKRLQTQIAQPVAANFEAVLAKLTWLAGQINQQQRENERIASLKNALQQQQTQKEKLDLQLKAVLANDQVENMAAYNQRYEASLRQIKLQTQIAALKDNLALNLPALTKLASQPQQLTEQRQTFIKEEQAVKEKIEQEQSAAAQLQVKLTNLADSAAVFTAKQDLANTETELLKVSQDYLANLLAGKWLDQTLNLASNERFPKMLAAARRYLALLTGGRYTDLSLNKKITLTRSDGRKRSVKYLSRGTAEQLYFALKLAFIEQIKDEINLPILIDDSFVNFDDRRVEYIKNLLQKISSSNQVLIFTAQEELVKRLGVKPLYFRKEKINA